MDDHELIYFSHDLFIIFVIMAFFLWTGYSFGQYSAWRDAKDRAKTYGAGAQYIEDRLPGSGFHYSLALICVGLLVLFFHRNDVSFDDVFILFAMLLGILISAFTIGGLIWKHNALKETSSYVTYRWFLREVHQENTDEFAKSDKAFMSFIKVQYFIIGIELPCKEWYR